MWKWIAVLCIAFTAALNAEIHVLAFAGSTRENSTNKKLIKEAAALASQMGAQVTVIDLRDYPMPLYDGDLEEQEGMPENAQEFRRLISQSQVIMIASPNYNGSFPGVLKNALDWASRSEEGGEARDVFREKKFAIMSASPGKSGGIKGLPHLRDVIGNLKGQVIPLQMGIPDADNAFDAQGKLTNLALKSQLEDLVRTLLTGE
jgi:chromate reductase, NAD(P)H dehydrogenase (quinone)